MLCVCEYHRLLFVSDLLHLENQKFGAVDTLLDENITNFFSFGVSWKVGDDNATELESWNNVLDVEPGVAGNEAGFRDILLHDSGLLFSLSCNLQLTSPFRCFPRLPIGPLSRDPRLGFPPFSLSLQGFLADSGLSCFLGGPFLGFLRPGHGFFSAAIFLLPECDFLFSCLPCFPCGDLHR